MRRIYFFGFFAGFFGSLLIAESLRPSVVMPGRRSAGSTPGVSEPTDVEVITVFFSIKFEKGEGQPSYPSEWMEEPIEQITVNW